MVVIIYQIFPGQYYRLLSLCHYDTIIFPFFDKTKGKITFFVLAIIII